MEKFLIADDHPLFREALIGALSPIFDEIEIVQSDSLETTLEALSAHSDIDLVLLDLNMPGCEHFYGLIRVTQDYPDVAVAVISASDSIKVVSQVMSFGAQGFIPKVTPTTVIADGIQAMLRDELWLPEGMAEQITSIGEDELSTAHRVAELTPKQFRVLKLLCDGLLNKQIADKLCVTEATVKAHISAIFRKLDVNTRTQAALLMDKLENDLSTI